jgi:hypothetical protein
VPGVARQAADSRYEATLHGADGGGSERSPHGCTWRSPQVVCPGQAPPLECRDETVSDLDDVLTGRTRLPWAGDEESASPDLLFSVQTHGSCRVHEWSPGSPANARLPAALPGRGRDGHHRAEALSLRDLLLDQHVNQQIAHQPTGGACPTEAPLSRRHGARLVLKWIRRDALQINKEG